MPYDRGICRLFDYNALVAYDCNAAVSATADSTDDVDTRWRRWYDATDDVDIEGEEMHRICPKEPLLLMRRRRG